MTTVNQTPQTCEISLMGLSQYDNACVIGKYLEGTKFQGTEFITRRLQCEVKSFRAE